MRWRTTSSPRGAERRRTALAVAAAVCWAQLAAAAPCTSTESCLAAVRAAQADTTALDARFVQTKHVALLDEPLVSTGRFRFRRPDHVRLDVETPQPATILIAGRSVRVPGLPDSEQRALAASPLAAMFTELGALFAGTLDAAPAHFDISARATDGDGITVTLTPNAPEFARLFRTIELRFGGTPLGVQSMRLDDPLDDHLVVELRDVRRNVDLPDALFTTP